MTKRTGPKTVTVHVPMKFSVGGGRKTIISEIGPSVLPALRTEDALLKALAKAFRWRSQIESGEYASITELARARGVNDSYACRLLRMTLLSPDIVTAILDGRQNPNLTLKQIARPLPKEWNRQLPLLCEHGSLFSGAHDGYARTRNSSYTRLATRNRGARATKPNFGTLPLPN
jgi:hypothetical protein